MSIAAILIAIPDNEPPADLEALIAAAEEGELPSCILETVWHGLHWLFTGTADGGDEPWCYLLPLFGAAATKSLGDFFGNPIAIYGTF